MKLPMSILIGNGITFNVIGLVQETNEFLVFPCILLNQSCAFPYMKWKTQHDMVRSKWHQNIANRRQKTDRISSFYGKLSQTDIRKKPPPCSACNGCDHIVYFSLFYSSSVCTMIFLSLAIQWKTWNGYCTNTSYYIRLKIRLWLCFDVLRKNGPHKIQKKRQHFQTLFTSTFEFSQMTKTFSKTHQDKNRK